MHARLYSSVENCDGQRKKRVEDVHAGELKTSTMKNVHQRRMGHGFHASQKSHTLLDDR